MASDVVSGVSLCFTWLVVLGSVELLFALPSPEQPSRAKAKTPANKISGTLFFLIHFCL